MAAALLVGACALLFFFNLGEEDVDSDAEARVLLTATEMNRNSTWIVPTVGGEGRWEKPPLYVWAVKLTSLFSEEITPLTGRLPGAVATMLLVLLGAGWTWIYHSRYPREDHPDLLPESVALLSGMLLATNIEIFNLAHAGSADTLFAFLCLAAYFCLGESFEARRSYYSARSWRQWVLAAYFLMGLAMLTRGPVAVFFVTIPYAATCWSYKMRRPDWVHIPGGLIFLVVGGWWYVTAMILDPAARGVFMDELFVRRFGSGAWDRESFYFYIEHFLKSFFPWNLLTLAVLWNRFRYGNRNPTREFWIWGLTSGTVALSLIGSKSAAYYLPVAPFVLLLAGDALIHMDFEHRWGMAFRALIRTLRWGVILAAIPMSLLFSSDLGLVLAVIMAVSCFAFLFYRQRSDYTWAWWERTRQGAWYLVIVLFLFEVVSMADYIPRKRKLSANRAFIARVRDHLPEGASLYLHGEDRRALYSWLLREMLPVTSDLEDLVQVTDSRIFVLSDDDIRSMLRHPNLAPVVVKLSPDSGRVRSALFQVLPHLDPNGNPTPQQRYASVPPLRLAVVGDATGDYGRQKDVASRIESLSGRKPVHGMVMVGDSLRGHTLRDRVDFYRSFERPWGEIIEAGIAVHGALGEDDQSIAPLLIEYPGYGMGGQRYYARDLRPGLVRLYVLDAYGLLAEDDAAEEQWNWLERDLRSEGAPWKLVVLHTPVISAVEPHPAGERIAGRLLPILDRSDVRMVITSSVPWYERLRDPAHAPMFLGGGWGCETDGRPRPADPRLSGFSSAEPGFVLIEIEPLVARVAAYDYKGTVVDEASIDMRGVQPQITPEPSA